MADCPIMQLVRARGNAEHCYARLDHAIANAPRYPKPVGPADIFAAAVEAGRTVHVSPELRPHIEMALEERAASRSARGMGG